MDAEEILAQMRKTRANLRPEVAQAVHDAQTLMDWQYYVMRYPLAAVGVGVAAGFLLVPQKLHVMSPDAATLSKLADQQRLVVEPQPKSAAKTGVVASAARSLAMLALRAGLAYAGHQLGERAFHKEQMENNKRQDRPQSPRPAAKERYR